MKKLQYSNWFYPVNSATSRLCMHFPHYIAFWKKCNWIQKLRIPKKDCHLAVLKLLVIRGGGRGGHFLMVKKILLLKAYFCKKKFGTGKPFPIRNSQSIKRTGKQDVASGNLCFSLIKSTFLDTIRTQQWQQTVLSHARVFVTWSQRDPSRQTFNWKVIKSN